LLSSSSTRLRDHHIAHDPQSTLLYQDQHSGQSLTEDEQELATTRIENSDDDSATALFQDIGTTSGLDAANKVFGLTDTSANPAWGVTTTTTDDQITLLRQIFTSDSVLSSSSRDYIQDLMSCRIRTCGRSRASARSSTKGRPC
jgi:hypothetical protein